MPSATPKLSSPQRKEIRNSLVRFNNASKKLNRTYKRFNIGKPPSQEAMLAALKALAANKLGGGKTRRRRR